MNTWIAGKDLMKIQYHQEAFYSEFNLGNITVKVYEHVKKVWETFEIKNLGEYHDLYV